MKLFSAADSPPEVQAALTVIAEYLLASVEKGASAQGVDPSRVPGAHFASVGTFTPVDSTAPSCEVICVCAMGDHAAFLGRVLAGLRSDVPDAELAELRRLAGLGGAE